MRKTAVKTAVKKKAPPRGKAPSRNAPPRKKGGPLRSKKPGRNQIAQARKQPSAGKKALRPRGGGAAAPAPVAAAAPAPAQQPDRSRPRALEIAQAGLDKKAEDVLVLDVRGLTSYADYFVLMTAESDRQAGAIADAVDEKLKAQGATKVGVEGYESGRWILVDYGDVVAHVFSREARGFYDLEGLWADAPRFQVQA
jgi:ribosome-associated protein